MYKITNLERLSIVLSIYLNQDASQWLWYGCLFVALLNFGLLVYGIWKMVKKKPFSLKYCILSVLVSIVLYLAVL